MGPLPSLNTNYISVKYQESLEQQLWVRISLASPLYSEEFLLFSWGFFVSPASSWGCLVGKKKDYFSLCNIFFLWRCGLKKPEFCSKSYYCKLAALWLNNMFILTLCCSFQKQNSAKVLTFKNDKYLLKYFILTYIGFTSVIFLFFCTSIHMWGKVLIGNTTVLERLIFERPNPFS